MTAVVVECPSTAVVWPNSDMYSAHASFIDSSAGWSACSMEYSRNIATAVDIPGLRSSPQTSELLWLETV